MQPINENDVLEVVIEGTNEQTPWALVRHYLVNSVTTPQAFLDALVTHWDGGVLALWQDVATTLWVAECISISRVAPVPMNVYYKGLSPAVVGEISSDGLPPQSAVLVRLTTDEVGARNRGRCYLTGCPEASTNGGVLLDSVKEDWEAVATAIATSVSGGGNSATPCIFSRSTYRIQLDPPDGPITHPENVADYTSAITGSSLQGNIATQRGRRVRRSSFSS